MVDPGPEFWGEEAEQWFWCLECREGTHTSAEGISQLIPGSLREEKGNLIWQVLEELQTGLSCCYGSKLLPVAVFLG